MQRILLVVGIAVIGLGAVLAGWQLLAGSGVESSPGSPAAGSDALVGAVPATADSPTDPPSGGVTGPTVASRLVPASKRAGTPLGGSTTTLPGPPTTVLAAPPASTGTTQTEKVVVAWQPSHQDDTGADGWHEYIICGDIAERAMALLAEGRIRSVLAWETGMGLTGSNNAGSNPGAFDSEIRKANEAGAHYFISLHNDGGAPSGVLGMYFSGDGASGALAERYARAVAAETGLPYRGIREAPLYSLDPVRNRAPVRILLEIGDNARDRAFLEDAAGRDKIARALAEVTGGLTIP